MKIVVIGGTGLIGSQVVDRLRAKGHEAIAASPSKGVDTITQVGLPEAMVGATVSVDVTNPPSFDDAGVAQFFDTSTRNVLAAAKTAGVRHHLALSIVGIESLSAGGYSRAKIAQEEITKVSGVPYTLLRATQFFEFLSTIVAFGSDNDVVRASPALLQPVSSHDVSSVLIDLIEGDPRDGTIEVAGPERLSIEAIAHRVLAANGDARRIVPDHRTGYFGVPIDSEALIPGGAARTGIVRPDDWLATARRPMGS